MNKTECVDKIAEKTGLTKTAAATALEAVLDGITESLQQHNPVVFIGFGAFTVKERAARRGRNPATGEPINIEATRAVIFKPGSELKKAVKQAKEEA